MNVKKLAMALTAATISGVSLAATPLAVWDGNFDATQTGYTLSLNDNILSSDKSTITISQNVGVTVTKDEDTFSGGFTVLVRYSDLNTALADKQVLATSTLTDANDRTGITINKSGKSCGIWDGGSWNNSGTYNSMTSDQASGVLAFVHYSATAYTGGAGTKLFSLGRYSAGSTTIMNAGNLGSNNDITKYKGFAIGGRSVAAEGFSGATGMKISGIAVFSGILTEQEMLAYRWPTDVSLTVDEDTSVSALNSQISQARRAFLSVADGVELTLDEEFAIPAAISSEGSVSLSAASQPDSSYFSNVDFSGVQGGLLRSWLTPGVVGFNFAKNYGNVVSDELVTSGNWVATTGANGTSTDLFADGLTKLTWSSGGVYSYSSSDNESVSFLHGYLDDGNNKGNGVEIYIDGVPFETYDVVIYASTDTSGAKFKAKTVNGSVYTADILGTVSSGSSVWGSSRLEIPVYGANAMRIKNLSGPLTIYGGLNTYSSDKARGGIAAIQIMPSNAEDNITEHTLVLDGTATNWSTGAWKVGTEASSAPLAGYAKITLSSSTTLIIDDTVALTRLVVDGADDAVLTLVTGSGTFVANGSVIVEGGVLQQGSASVIGATPAVVVEDGATFDLNGLGINSATAVTIAGAGAGSWPWALTSSSGAGGAILGGLYLSANATIGGANELKVGQTQNGYQCYLQGFTLTKTGEGAFTCTNMNTPGTGTIDVQGGDMSVNQWNNLNSSSGDTDVILRSGASLKNNTDRVISMRSLLLDGGTLITSSRAFKVKTLLTGSGETAKLALADGATVVLTGELSVTDELALDGSLTISTRSIAPAEFVVGQTIDLLTAPSDTTLSADTITVESNPRYETAISGNKVTATVLNVVATPFLHYDFNAANSIASDSAYNFGNLNPTFVSGKNGKAGVFDSNTKPYYGSNTSEKSPFYAGEMTVTTLLKVQEANNTILWNFGSGWSVGMALIAKNSSTISVVSWTGGAAGSDVVSVTDVADLMNKWHLVTIVADANGTTLYVDGKSATTTTVLPSAISGQGQFGSIHGTAKNYSAVSGNGFLLDDWRVYDAALTLKEVSAIKKELAPDPFSIRIR